MQNYAVVTLATALFLAACSANAPRSPLLSEAFIATITDTGLRQFTYSITMNMAARGPGKGPGGEDRNGGMNSGRGGFGSPDMEGRRGSGRDVEALRRRMDVNAEHAIRQRLTATLEDTGYCPHGWFIIRENFHSGFGEVLGECKASAQTRAD